MINFIHLIYKDTINQAIFKSFFQHLSNFILVVARFLGLLLIFAKTYLCYGCFFNNQSFFKERRTFNLQFTKMPNIPEHCLTMNEDLNSYNFSSIKSELDYIFYIIRTQDMLDIPWQKLKGLSISRTNEFDYA